MSVVYEETPSTILKEKQNRDKWVGPVENLNPAVGPITKVWPIPEEWDWDWK